MVSFEEFMNVLAVYQKRTLPIFTSFIRMVEQGNDPRTHGFIVNTEDERGYRYVITADAPGWVFYPPDPRIPNDGPTAYYRAAGIEIQIKALSIKETSFFDYDITYRTRMV